MAHIIATYLGGNRHFPTFFQSKKLISKNLISLQQLKNTFGISGILDPWKFLVNQDIQRSKCKPELRAGE